MNEEKEKRLAEHITDELNGRFDREKFCDAMSREHRFLQYEFTELCLKWLEKCAEMYDEKRYDDRNESACKTGKLVTEFMNTL